MVRNKRGVIRIAEATIAVIIVISFLIIVQIRIGESSEVNFSEKIYNTLEEIAKNSLIRDEIFIAKNIDSNGFVKEDSEIYTFVRERIPENYLNLEIRICDEVDEICSLGFFIDGEIYSGQRVIVPSVEQQGFKAKKIAIFAYRNEI